MKIGVSALYEYFHKINDTKQLRAYLAVSSSRNKKVELNLIKDPTRNLRKLNKRLGNPSAEVGRQVRLPRMHFGRLFAE